MILILKLNIQCKSEYCYFQKLNLIFLYWLELIKPGFSIRIFLLKSINEFKILKFSLGGVARKIFLICLLFSFNNLNNILLVLIFKIKIKFFT